MAVATGDKKSHGDRRLRIVAQEFGTVFVNESCFVRPPAILHQLEDTRFDRRQRVAKWAAQPSREWSHWNTDGRCGGISVVIVGYYWREKELFDLRPKSPLDCCDQPFLFDFVFGA
jgi:hypothetical protein